MNVHEEPFPPFAKIPRLKRVVCVTEKIDGTNALVAIDDAGGIRAGSRSRWLTPAEDNFGFARWVEGNKEELLKLGPGHHYGEWWGAGIQRRYGLPEKRFSLFNSKRWMASDVVLPECCHVVPLIAEGVHTDELIDGCIVRLRINGSLAAPGFMKPEGVVVYHTAAGTYFKVTLEKDEERKTA